MEFLIFTAIFGSMIALSVVSTAPIKILTEGNDILNEANGTIISVVGESFKNPDGQDRQLIISKLNAGDAAYFVLEHDNPYDKRAIAVFTTKGQIGYVGKDDAARRFIERRLKEGLPIEAHVLNILGAAPGRPYRGVWLDVAIDLVNEQRALERKSRKKIDLPSD